MREFSEKLETISSEISFEKTASEVMGGEKGWTHKNKDFTGFRLHAGIGF
jgi:hypothetical protein